jgi:anti-sigma factor (TIGR02949 family)
MNEDCDEIRLLIQADLDGELTPADAARVAAHLERCPRCAETQADLGRISHRVREDTTTYPASEQLRARIAAQVAAAIPRPAPKRQPWILGASFGLGAALAAGLMLLLLPVQGPDLADALVASHIHALQPGHLMDVVSTDQHTVKPWFDGRLPFAPPVKDLAAQGFPLTGGRLDYLAGQPAAALTYSHGKHVIDLYVFANPVGPLAPSGSRDGYNYVEWRQDGMSFWAVSDLNAEDMTAFAADWRRM